jgi:glycosyltransferase involved in cell wall biosynthesis
MPGDGPTFSDVQAAVAGSPFADRIALPGFMASPEDAYQAMDVLLMPSLFEGMSNAILEAMACGVPALAHNACGCSDVITHGSDGFLVDLNADEAIDDALVRLMESEKDLPRLGTNARETVETRYSLDTMASAYADLYESIAGRG